MCHNGLFYVTTLDCLCRVDPAGISPSVSHPQLFIVGNYESEEKFLSLPAKMGRLLYELFTCANGNFTNNLAESLIGADIATLSEHW